MTQLLEKALTAIQNLPDEEQDAIAALILAELADEHRWETAFASSQQKLAELAAKAREDALNGRVHSRGFDEL